MELLLKQIISAPKHLNIADAMLQCGCLCDYKLWLRYPFRIGLIHHWWQPGTISVHWSHCSPLCLSCCCIICLPLNSKGNKQTSVGPGADGYFQHSLLCSPYIWLQAQVLFHLKRTICQPLASVSFYPESYMVKAVTNTLLFPLSKHELTGYNRSRAYQNVIGCQQ